MAKREEDFEKLSLLIEGIAGVEEAFLHITNYTTSDEFELVETTEGIKAVKPRSGGSWLMIVNLAEDEAKEKVISILREFAKEADEDPEGVRVYDMDGEHADIVLCSEHDPVELAQALRNMKAAGRI